MEIDLRRRSLNLMAAGILGLVHSSGGALLVYEPWEIGPNVVPHVVDEGEFLEVGDAINGWGGPWISSPVKGTPMFEVTEVGPAADFDVLTSDGGGKFRGDLRRKFTKPIELAVHPEIWISFAVSVAHSSRQAAFVLVAERENDSLSAIVRGASKSKVGIRIGEVGKALPIEGGIGPRLICHTSPTGGGRRNRDGLGVETNR